MTIDELIDKFTDKLAEKLAQKLNPIYFYTEPNKPIDNVVCMYGAIHSQYYTTSTITD